MEELEKVRKDERKQRREKKFVEAQRLHLRKVVAVFTHRVRQALSIIRGRSTDLQLR